MTGQGSNDGAQDQSTSFHAKGFLDGSELLTSLLIRSTGKRPTVKVRRAYRAKTIFRRERITPLDFEFFQEKNLINPL